MSEQTPQIVENDTIDNIDDTDTDIMAFLDEIAQDQGRNDKIEDEPVDADLAFGIEDIDNSFETALEGIEVEGGVDVETKANANAKAEVAKQAPVKSYEPEPEGVIDESITPGDMMSLIHSEIVRKKVAGHHIDSMNSFNNVGIKQIATKVFVVEGRQKNQRDKTDEDKEIAEITYKVNFTDINLTKPTTVKYKSGAVQMLTPNMARLKNLTYSAQMYIDAQITATAIYKNGMTKTRTAEFKNHRIASIPCEVGTELCNTYNCSKESLKNIEEDPHNPGGYFIIKGLEWTIDNLENITNNTFHVYKHMYLNEFARGTFLSKPGDAFENSYQVILRYLNNGLITVEITTNKFDKFEIPYYLIFRALGMSRDRDIVNHIVYGVDNQDTVTKSMLEILERAFEVEEGKFAPIRKSTNPTEIVQFIAQRITESANTAAARKDDNIAKYLNNNILNIIDRYIFPHIGTGIEHRIKKLRFFGHLINKLLCVYMEVLEPTDRDSYRNKRVFAAGTSMAKTFKTNFNFAIVQDVKKHLAKDFKTTPFSQVQLAESVKAAINNDDLERMLTQSITTGNKTITVKRNEITNRISSQTLYHKNDLNVKSTLNTINTPNTTASKQNERADEMRRVHPTYLGYIDISQSADTGEKVGMTKQMASTASVCGASSSFVLKRILQDDPDIIDLDKIEPEQITADKLAKVFVNGDWIGCCKQPFELARKYRMKRRRDDIHHLTTIVCELSIREVYFWTDVGRLMRPLVIVYNNLAEYIDNWRNGDRTVKFKQWVKLTKNHIRGLQSKKLSMDDLRKQRVIEYISPEEQENTYIADNIDILRSRQYDLQHRHTHCDIDQAIFGIVTLAAPMANHSNAVRNTMYTNHRKQSAGWFALNFPFRIDKNVTFQHYCERPIISVFADSLTSPNGHNTIVALALHGGENQEDSIKANQSSIDCGAYNAAHYNYEKAELEKGEQFGNPDYARTMDIKKDAIYEYVHNGFIAEGTIAKKGYVLIVKAAKIPKPVDQFLYIDKSIVYKREEQVYIERVITTRNDEDALIAKVKWRANRPMCVGDKFSSRTGNKGICATKVPRCDMPYCEDGLVPDLIVNAHSIPTRMAVNQITECVLGQLAARKGSFIDATSFRKLDIDGAVAELEKRGIKYGGHRRMYNGKTGDWIDTLIFIGPTTYQRLQKFVIDEHYATRTGPTSALTRQPLDGKNNDGGLRLGEMEKDVFCAHGTMRALFEKFYKDSDGIDLPICRVCGNRAVVNEKMGIYKCKYCGDNADIVNVASSWVANLLFHEMSAMNIKMSFNIAPFTYSKQEE
jgi:DNA-directed RNA polymerase beta subunit